MGVQSLILVIDKREVKIDFDVSHKLSDLRKYLNDKGHITKEHLLFTKVVDGQVGESVELGVEKYIQISEFVFDKNRVRMVGLDKPLQFFAGTSREYFDFDVSKLLVDLRTTLVAKGLIVKDDDEHGWRFVSPNVEDPDGDISEAIIGLDGSEKLIKVKDFLFGNNKVRMTNIRSQKHPDLIGAGANKLTDRSVEVQVTLNRRVTDDKFQPIMMQSVKTTNPSVVANFQNVVLCERGTAVGFTITVKGHNGFGYSITTREGDPIVSGLYSLSPRNGISFYQESRKAIEIVSFKDLDIPSQAAIGYRRLTVKVWRFISYLDASETKHYVDSTNYMNEPVGRGVELVPGDGIEGGAVHEGEQTDGQLGVVYDVEDDKNDIFGQVEIDLFVFKTHEDAQRTVDMRVEPLYD